MKLKDVDKPLSILFYSLEPLTDKTLSLLIQLPPFLSEKKGFNPLKDTVHYLDKRFRYSLEVRHTCWLNDKVYDFLKENNISLVWSVRDELKSPLVVASYQVYIRFIGDRGISSLDFCKKCENFHIFGPIATHNHMYSEPTLNNVSSMINLKSFSF